MEKGQLSIVRPFAVLPLLVLFTGCSHPTLYSWGQYEDLVYESYAKQGSLPPEAQIEKLEQDYQVARSRNQKVPPGWHAHLGYLYYQAGKLDQAKQEFETEKANFPESAAFMDRLLSRLKNG